MGGGRMKPREITSGVYFLGVPHWNRRLFDNLIPLPEGTSYNAYLIKATGGTVLVDTVEPTVSQVLFQQLRDLKVDHIDYIVSNHAEQDHSGAIPQVLERFPKAQMLCSDKAKDLLVTHLHVPEDKVRVMKDGERLSLGDRTLRFVYTPWVHWPETMVTFLEEERILFSCDFFGSHLASYSMYASSEPQLEVASKRYYAEIMAPFRGVIKKNIEKVESLKPQIIAPSHGPIHDDPQRIMTLYKKWIDDKPTNLVLVVYVTMHGSVETAVDHFCDALTSLSVPVKRFDLTVSDVGELAMTLVDAATVVVAAPTVLTGLHPLAVSAAYLINAFRPKAIAATGIISYGWGTKAPQQLEQLMANLKSGWIDPVVFKGLPDRESFESLTNLARKIKQIHERAEIGN